MFEENFIERGDIGKIGSAFQRPKMEILQSLRKNGGAGAAGVWRGEGTLL